MKSIMHNGNNCFICGDRPHPSSLNRLEEHHVFGGSNRKWSEKYGLKVHLCGDKCHRNGPRAAHQSGETMQLLHEAGQRAFEEHHGTREEFMRIFGRNYL